MKWSRYNYRFSSKHGKFIYNSTTNSFLKVSQKNWERITEVNDWDSEIENLDQDFKNILLTNRILVPNDFDDKYLSKLKYIHQKSAFANNRLALTIATTTDCNFRCPYCYEEGIAATKMTQETEDAIIDYIKSVKPRTLNVMWYGGEPLLNFNTIKRLTLEIGKLDFLDKVEYEMVTNGSLFTERVCDFFADQNITRVQMTIDGLKENHNNSRVTKNGKDSYDVIMKNLDNAIHLLPECYFSVRVNISQFNKDDYPVLCLELYKKYSNRKNFGVYFSFIEDYNMCGGSDCLNSLEKIEFISHLKDNYGIDDNIFPNFKGGTAVCTANSVNNFVIAPNGDLFKCWNELGRRECVVGNIKDKKKISNYDFVCDYAVNYDKFSDSKCLNCFLFPVCSGGCPYRRYRDTNYGSSLGICPYNHEHMDATLELIYERTTGMKLGDIVTTG